jgi:hypothetical protein
VKPCPRCSPRALPEALDGHLAVPLSNDVARHAIAVLGVAATEPSRCGDVDARAGLDGTTQVDQRSLPQLTGNRPIQLRHTTAGADQAIDLGAFVEELRVEAQRVVYGGEGFVVLCASLSFRARPSPVRSC